MFIVVRVDVEPVDEVSVTTSLAATTGVIGAVEAGMAGSVDAVVVGLAKALLGSFSAATVTGSTGTGTLGSPRVAFN
jgi:uncharacterized membrane protein YqgA involved in biofilm formation